MALPAHGFRASGCHQAATYVCANGICVQNVADNPAPSYAAAPPPPPAPKESKAEAEAPKQELGTIAHDGAAFDLPDGFTRDDEAKGELYRDAKHHHAARLTIDKSATAESDWIASHYPTAKTWTAKVGERTLTFATQVGSKLRITVAVFTANGKLYELACSSDDVTSEKTDAVCTKILASFRLKAPEGGLPGE